MRILLIDDDVLSLQALTNFLESILGHEVTACHTAEAALKHFEEQPFPLIISDIRLPTSNGLNLLDDVKSGKNGDLVDVVMVTGYADVQTAVQALRGGAYDFLTKPIDTGELGAVIQRVEEHQSLLRENKQFKKSFNEKLAAATKDTEEKLLELQGAYANVVGIGTFGIFSDAMRKVVELAYQFHSDRSVPVLIEGETGTGKEVIARLVHYGSGDVVTPFVSVNCAAIPPTLFESEMFGYEGGAYTGSRKDGMPGKFESAQGGTIFIDEIGELPLDMQTKLLRVLQEREVYRVGGVKRIPLDIRIICASNKDLSTLIQEKKFRPDLYYRLNVARILLPPLRSRKEEIGPLAQMFLTQFAEQKKRRFKTLHPDVLPILEAHDWPGNVRELQNVIERVVLLYDDVEARPEYFQFLFSELDLPEQLLGNKTTNQLTITFTEDALPMKHIEHLVMKKVLTMFHVNISRGAEYLQIARSTLRKNAKSL